MFRPLVYFVLGLTLLGTVGVAEHRGWALLGATRVQNVPRSLRDNPGAYRSHYRSSPRYFGGK
jgi:hypothetical protein